jgi:hypothetical protein
VLELIKQKRSKLPHGGGFKAPTSAAETNVFDFYAAAFFRCIHKSANINKMAYITCGVGTRCSLVVIVVVVAVMRTVLKFLLHNIVESGVNLLNTSRLKIISLQILHSVTPCQNNKSYA